MAETSHAELTATPRPLFRELSSSDFEDVEPSEFVPSSFVDTAPQKDQWDHFEGT